MAFHNMHKYLLILLIFINIGCAQEESGNRIWQISREEGLFTKSLYYIGSDSKYHYFRQRKNFPGVFISGIKAYKVCLEELHVPKDISFTYNLHNPRYLKVRIHNGNPPFVTKRK